MKKILIIASVIVLIIFLSVFVYIIFFGTPKSVDDVFTTFGLGGPQEQVIVPVTPIEGGVVETPSVAAFDFSKPLNKITDRPIAGMGFIGTTTIRYAEKGTGHLYQMDLLEGEEELISNTTYRRVLSAIFSDDGTSVIFEIEGSNNLEIFVGSITKDNMGETTLVGVLLPEGAHDAYFSNGEMGVTYLLPKSAGSEVRTYSIPEKTDRGNYTLPQKDLRGAWPSYVYVTPTANLSGYIYDVRNQKPEYVTEGGFGLTAFPYTNGVVVTSFRNEELQSIAYEDDNVYTIPIEVLPEKCADTHQATSTLVCAAPEDRSSWGAYPDDWYKGITSSEDVFWKVSVWNNSALQVLDPQEYVRSIDVAKIISNNTGDIFLFIDKNDNSLWFAPFLGS